MARPKGQKLGPRTRDNWQIKIDFNRRNGNIEEAKQLEFRREFCKKNFSFINPYLEKYGENTGFVYVLKTLKGKPVYKIGKSKSLRSRVNLYHSEKKNVGVELILLKHTKDYELFEEKTACGREWFWLIKEDIELLKKYFIS
ncbi:hypothetical protein [Halobacillus sp. H74]|uniref:hypothetical protein n=1 Tax=Halobacillus sp. H74 TaxID=3457436 RepID=UPI003FCE51E7